MIETLSSRERAAETRNPGGWLLPVRVLLFGLCAPVLVRRGPERMAALLERASSEPPSTDPRMAEALARRVDRCLRAGWPLVRRGCLTRGVTLYRFLRRAGFDVSLRFGIGEVNGRLEGHCWLVHDNRPLLEKRDPRAIYTETWRIPWTPPVGEAVVLRDEGREEG
jgi:hypothetical protein